ncbi:MAG: hypothetical protein A2W91_13360 [Bacteroidetes bacterium GWF2_38_335]|nr:MAG: hypothetical protein A2W91_13360 [Bacteroidetes bacterium GWF2_38_335]OFY77242.1 MAG: hypothetical protein A2281_15025 [Bacteroidetes bacterium RIFOXYA12_FULL_38_20]HBS85756.1 hypothetical protein [Bacteroidales bacterium]
MTLFRTFILLLLIPAAVYSQQPADSVSPKSIRKSRPAFINICLGISGTNYRDFATSPMIYRGSGFNFNLEFLRFDKERERMFSVSNSFGGYGATSITEYTSSSAFINSIKYTRLFKLNGLPTEKWNLKIGGSAFFTNIIRTNVNLHNNSTGFEMFHTIFISGKITRDVSRKKTKEKILFFIPYRRVPRQRELSMQLNLPFMNNTFRNGFLYFNQTFLSDVPQIFYEYEYKMFSGFRISSIIDYTIKLKNCNSLKISYVWDAYKTSAVPEKFEMAHHFILFSLMFNTK